MEDIKVKIKKSLLPMIGLILSGYTLRQSLNIPHMSTHSFRTELTEKGINLTGKDIDHIVPKNLGGIDHPLNYQVVDSSLNSSWQDGDLIQKTSINPTGMLGGILISYIIPPVGTALSLYCGYKCIKKLKKIWI